MNIRTAVARDADQILDIYAPVIEHTAVSFELTVPTVDEIRKRIESYTNTHEWLVAEIADVVVGYAYGTPHRSREAYQYAVETAIYVHENARGEGVGKALYTELLGRLKDAGFHSAFAGIALPNDASEALHKSIGFKPIGIFEEIGFKFDSWHDVSWWQRKI